MAANQNNANDPDAKDLRNVAGAANASLTGDFVLTNPEAKPHAPESVGELLRSAREIAGLSQADVANRLRMGLKQIDALERADYAVLPSGTFLRGFVRNYAKAVGVTVEDALATLERTHTNAAALNATPVVAPTMAASPISLQKRSDLLATPKARVLIATGVVLLLAAAAWYWWANVRPYMADGGRPKPEAVAATESINPTAVAQPSVDTAIAQNVQTASVDTALPPPIDAASASAAPPAPATLPAAGIPAPALTPSSATDANIASVQTTSAEPDKTQDSTKDVTKAKRRASDTALIGFTFAGQSWVEVVDGAGRTILSRRYSAGEADEVSGRGPFSIVVGNATVTRMAYNGREFDLSPHRRSNSTVARVNVK
jgi:cytoskeleton protein RodZ